MRHKNLHRLKVDGKINTSPRTLLESSDCTVRAYAEAFDISYQDSHKKLSEFGRQMRQGIVFEHFMFKYHPDIKPYPRPHMTVGVFVHMFTKGTTWILKVRGHVFCVKDRVIFDSLSDESAKLANINRHVLTAWMIK
jgi:hypothetical protein